MCVYVCIYICMYISSEKSIAIDMLHMSPLKCCVRPYTTYFNIEDLRVCIYVVQKSYMLFNHYTTYKYIYIYIYMHVQKKYIYICIDTCGTTLPYPADPIGWSANTPAHGQN